jgi:hypothetical protein
VVYRAAPLLVSCSYVFGDHLAVDHDALDHLKRSKPRYEASIAQRAGESARASCVASLARGEAFRARLLRGSQPVAYEARVCG